MRHIPMQEVPHRAKEPLRKTHFLYLEMKDLL